MLVSTLSIGPALDDADVISENFEMNAGGSSVSDCLDEELKADAFCPSDVATVRLPVPNEMPGTPVLANDDCDASAAGIRKCLWVKDGLRSGDGKRWEGDVGKGRRPPF